MRAQQARRLRHGERDALHGTHRLNRDDALLGDRRDLPLPFSIGAREVTIDLVVTRNGRVVQRP
jgi:hypothetical protein